MKHDDLIEKGSDFLSHYGVKGMRKGVRRWTNEDGSLTPAGYLHYGIDPNGRNKNNNDQSLKKQRNRETIKNFEQETKKYMDGYDKEYDKYTTLSGLFNLKYYGKDLKDITPKDIVDSVYGTKVSDLDQTQSLSIYARENNLRNEMKSLSEKAYKLDEEMPDEFNEGYGNRDTLWLYEDYSDDDYDSQMNFSKGILSKLTNLEKANLSNLNADSFKEDYWNIPWNKLEPWQISKINEALGNLKHDDLVANGEEFLVHYGIKGMQKGVRRWTNEDGTLTEAGKEHYGIGLDTGTKTNKKATSVYAKAQKAYAEGDYYSKVYGEKAKKYDEKHEKTEKEKYVKKHEKELSKVEKANKQKEMAERLLKQIEDSDNFDKINSKDRTFDFYKTRGRQFWDNIPIIIPTPYFTAFTFAPGKSTDTVLMTKDKTEDGYKHDVKTVVEVLKSRKEKKKSEKKKVEHDDLIANGEDFLAHYGIKGQQWGQRRFQNEDGSLTPEGRRRYGLNPAYANLTDQEMRDALAKDKTRKDYMRLMTAGARKKKEEVSNLTREAFKTARTGVTLYEGTRIKADKDYADEQIKQNQDQIKAYKQLSPNNWKTEYAQQIAESAENIRSHKMAKAGADARMSLAKGVLKDEVANPVSNMVGSTAAGKELKEKTAEAQRNIMEMEPDDLKKVVDRMMLEKQYDELVNPPKPSKIERGREVLQTIGSILGVALTALSIYNLAKNVKNPKVKDDKSASQSDEDGEYLAHYRTKGSRNGVRRYQNEDGSLTPEGYRHYGIDPNGRQAADPREMLARQRAQQKMEARQFKAERRQASYTQKFQQRQALRDAKNQAKIQNVYDRQALQNQREQLNIQNQAAAENRRNVRKNIVKGVLSVAAIGAALYTGRHFLQQRALDNQHVRDMEKILENNRVDIVKARMQAQNVAYSNQTDRLVKLENARTDRFKATNDRITNRDNAEIERYKAETDRYARVPSSRPTQNPNPASNPTPGPASTPPPRPTPNTTPTPGPASTPNPNPTTTPPSQGRGQGQNRQGQGNNQTQNRSTPSQGQGHGQNGSRGSGIYSDNLNQTTFTEAEVERNVEEQRKRTSEYYERQMAKQKEEYEKQINELKKQNKDKNNNQSKGQNRPNQSQTNEQSSKGQNRTKGQTQRQNESSQEHDKPSKGQENIYLNEDQWVDKSNTGREFMSRPEMVRELEGRTVNGTKLLSEKKKTTEDRDYISKAEERLRRLGMLHFTHSDIKNKRRMLNVIN